MRLVLICCERKVLLTGWWLVLIWCERKTMLAGWLTSQQNRLTVANHQLIIIIKFVINSYTHP